MNNPNIIESVAFMNEEDLLVAELDRRLSFSSVTPAESSRKPDCAAISVCSCLIYYPPPPCPGQVAGPSAVRG